MEHVLEENGQLRPLLSLVLFDTPSKGGEVGAKVAAWGSWAPGVVEIANRGTHAGARDVPLLDLVKETRRFCARLRKVTE